MELSQAEASRIWRRRYYWRQKDVAKTCRRWEIGETAVDPDFAQHPGKLSDGEFAQILRQREGDSQKEAAKRFSKFVEATRSHQYIVEVEHDRRTDQAYIKLYIHNADVFVPEAERATAFVREPTPPADR